MSNHYIVCGSKSWNKTVFDERISSLEGEWHFVSNNEELTEAFVQSVSPKIIFFLHWSWKVPPAIYEVYECINFHMTDVPYGRGGSPLQNLIVRGHTDTKLSALRMTDEMDAGPVYAKEPMTLDGTATEIFTRSSELAANMIRHIIETQPESVPQKGEITAFTRRKPSQSKLENIDNLDQIYNYIRMLDGEGYPPAFIEHEGFRYEFTDAKPDDDSMTATVRITRSPTN